MSEYLPSFIVEPVLRQARRFSSRAPHSDPQTPVPGPIDIPLPHADISQAGYLSAVPDFQRFYPSRFWNTSTPPPGAGTIPRDETVEGTWQSLARNIQLWANQINNLDIIPSPPLHPMQDDAVTDDDGQIAFPPLETETPTSRPPLQEQRTASETSLNPAQELFSRSRQLADVNRGHSHSDPLSHPGNDQPLSRSEPVSATPENAGYGRRDGSGALPEDDGMGPLRQRINAINAGPGTPADKSRLIHILMTESYTRSQTPPTSRGRTKRTSADRAQSPLSMGSTQVPHAGFDLTEDDVAPTYAPPDVDEGGIVQSKPDLGCQHYKRNVKMQCFTCERWYTCRLCHDEVEDHVLPRRETRNMLCMLCRTPQGVSQTCKNCLVEAACYYCAICKLWNNDPERSIYHCDDCGICRLGDGLGKDFFHCKTCAACMSIQAEKTHRCIERSTKCDCPICGEYMFTSNRPVAFMKCGHSIHESCFGEWCVTSYKCPICSKSIANMESQFRRLDRHIEDQPMPEEYRDNRAYIFCNDCNDRSITSYHWLGLKCSLCESYNTTQLELLGPEQTPQQIREQNERAQALGVGEAGLTASQTHTPSNELTSPLAFTPAGIVSPRPVSTHLDHDRARSPTSPYLLPRSPTRSARSVTPVVGSYFGTSTRSDPPPTRPEAVRRESYFSIFSAGQPMTPQSSQTQTSAHVMVDDEDEEMDFWGGQSPRSGGVDIDMHVEEDGEGGSGSSASSSDEDEDEAMTDDEEDEVEDEIALFGHR